MKYLFSVGLSLSLLASSLFADEPAKLYQFGGASFTTKDLSPALRQAVYEIQRQAYENIKKVVDANIIEEYAKKEAKKKNMPVDKFEAQLFKGKTIGDNDAKKWFEENKARLGNREFETIKNDIKQLLQSQEDDKVRSTLLTKIKGEGKFHFEGQEPQAPVMEIVTQGYPVKGSDKAKVQIVEFADYKCPHCIDASKALKALVDKYKDKVQFVYLDFPIDRSGVSKKVAEGGVCADKQKKFWEYHYMAFAGTPLSPTSPVDFAKKLNLDMKAFEACLSAPETTKKVELSRTEGERVGVDGTPTIYFNGRKVYGHSEQMLEDALKKLL